VVGREEHPPVAADAPQAFEQRSHQMLVQALDDRDLPLRIARVRRQVAGRQVDDHQVVRRERGQRRFDLRARRRLGLGRDRHHVEPGGETEPAPERRRGDHDAFEPERVAQPRQFGADRRIPDPERRRHALGTRPARDAQRMRREHVTRAIPWRP
jgi:hypothetical protein